MLLAGILKWWNHFLNNMPSLKCVSDSFTYSWDSCPPFGLTSPASVWELLPCLFISCFAVFSVLFWREMEEVDLGENWGEGRVGSSGRRGNHGWGTLYERKIFFNRSIKIQLPFCINPILGFYQRNWNQNLNELSLPYVHEDYLNSEVQEMSLRWIHKGNLAYASKWVCLT